MSLGLFKDHVAEGGGLCLGEEELGSVAGDKSYLPPRRNPRNKHQEWLGYLHLQGQPGNSLFELSCLLPGLPAMLRAILSFVEEEMAA